MSKYDNIYKVLKEQILTTQIKNGEKMPSIRKASEFFGVSKTTIQNAYFNLVDDGLIISEPKSGYYVSYINSHNELNDSKINKDNNIKFDFTKYKADKNSFDFNIWRRYIKSALRQDEKLLTYSEPQGELELRQVLSDYIRKSRNVITSPDRIIIGAGVQSLLGVFCSLIDEKSTVSFPDKSFYQGSYLFNSFGFNVTYRNKDANIIYVSPSHMTKFGNVMSNKRRLELVKYSKQNNSLIIEDDYESDFLYNKRPTPSLYALSDDKNVVYIGSFSKLLLPSIRISFMVLTKELSEKYKNNIYCYNQTASKTEQIALCQFIRDGRLKSQTKKTRRFYTVKNKKFALLLQKELPNTKIEISENALQIKIETPFNKNLDVFEQNHIKVNVESYENGILKIVLNISGIPEDNFSDAIKIIKKSIL